MMSHFDWPIKKNKNSKHWGDTKIDSNSMASKSETEGGAFMGAAGWVTMAIYSGI
jgi:hypothetical protein